MCNPEGFACSLLYKCLLTTANVTQGFKTAVDTSAAVSGHFCGRLQMKLSGKDCNYYITCLIKQNNNILLLLPILIIIIIIKTLNLTNLTILKMQSAIFSIYCSFRRIISKSLKSHLSSFMCVC